MKTQIKDIQNQLINENKYNLLIYCLGVTLIIVFLLERAPGLFNGLWGDEIDNNFIYLAYGNTPEELSRRICYFMKTFPDFAIKKWFWFQLFKPTEMGFSLIPWIYSGLSLFLILFIPWTRYREIRITGVILFGICALERYYSTEAQYYSYVSLSIWIYLIGLGFAFYFLEKERNSKTLVSFFLSLAAGLNSHYFCWPVIFFGFVIYTLYFINRNWKKNNNIWIWRFLSGVALILGVTVIINSFSLVYLIMTPPSGNAEFQLKWKMAFEKIPALWRNFYIPFPFLFAGTFVSFFHPHKFKRKIAWCSGIASGPLLFLTIILASARSSFPLSDRYFIGYMPVILTSFVLGIEASVLHLQNLNQKIGRLVPFFFACLIFFFSGKEFIQTIKNSPPGWQKLVSTSANYSQQFHFYEKVKELNKSTLVLHNDCWLSSFPGTYMKHLGNPFHGEFLEILNIKGCETTPAELIDGIDEFYTHHDKNGIIVLSLKYFPDRNEKSPCPTTISPIIMEEWDNRTGSCRSVYHASEIEPWIENNLSIIEARKNYVPEKKDNRSRSEKLKRIIILSIYYGGPLCLFALFLYFWKKRDYEN